MTSTSKYELRIFLDYVESDAAKRRLKLLYTEMSKQELGGAIPIFWPGDYGVYDDDNLNKHCHLAAGQTRKLNHKIRCVMIEKKSDGSLDRVPFTITEFDNVCQTLILSSKVNNKYERGRLIFQTGPPPVGELYVPSQISEGKYCESLNITMSNIGSVGISLQFGIAYAGIYGPDLTQTPNIVIVDNVVSLIKLPINARSNQKKYYDKEALQFKNFVKNIEKKNQIGPYNKNW
jgi:hypothetical protein